MCCCSHDSCFPGQCLCWSLPELSVLALLAALMHGSNRLIAEACRLQSLLCCASGIAQQWLRSFASQASSQKAAAGRRGLQQQAPQKSVALLQDGCCFNIASADLVRGGAASYSRTKYQKQMRCHSGHSVPHLMDFDVPFCLFMLPASNLRNAAASIINMWKAAN